VQFRAPTLLPQHSAPLPPACLQVCSAWRKGRVDAVVQSTDKNFMVPVGGAVIAARRGATQLVRGGAEGLVGLAGGAVIAAWWGATQQQEAAG